LAELKAFQIATLNKEQITAGLLPLPFSFVLPIVLPFDECIPYKSKTGLIQNLKLNFYNVYKDGKVGKSPFICILFYSIRAILAELEASQTLANSSFHALHKCAVEHEHKCAIEHVLGYNLSFLSFYELYKCAVEHSLGHGNLYAKIHERFKTSFSSIRAKMAELEPIENLELLYTSNYHEDKEKDKELAANYDAGLFEQILQFCSKDGSTILYNLLILRGQLHERFEHSLDPIRAILAELEAFQILAELEAFQILTLYNEVNVTFSSFCELYKCAIEHVFQLENIINIINVIYSANYSPNYNANYKHFEHTVWAQFERYWLC
jgi:hypothetical protein